MTEYLSKSEVKRRFKQMEEMAAELAELTENDLKRFPGSEELKAEIKTARNQKGGALKRQIKYIAKVMREENLEPLLDFLTERKGSQLKAAQYQKEIESIRDRLINDAIYYQQSLDVPMDFGETWPSPEFDALLGRYKTVNAGELRKTIARYVRSRSMQYYRETFRIIKAALDSDALAKRRAG